MKKTVWGRLFRLLFWIIMVFAVLFGLKWGARTLFPVPYGEEVEKRGAENGISPSLIYAVMKAESNFNKDAVSQKGAIGLMQMMPETAIWCGEKMGKETAPNLSAPAESIEVGAYYLAFLINRYGGDVKTAVAAYNAGHGRVDSWLSDKACSADGKTLSKIPFPETEKYVKKVMLYKKIYERIYGM